MKKVLICFMIIFAFLLTSCNLDLNNGNNQGEDNTENNNGSDDNKEPVKKDVVPLYAPDTIRNNIKAYSHSFKFSSYDSICTYDIKFDYETSTGIAIIQNFNADNEKIDEATEYFFIMDKDYDCLSYGKSSEFNSHSFNKDTHLKFFYIRLLFDYTNEIYEDAPYESKTEVTYAGRQATKYIVSDRDYIMAADTKLTIILDNETGAVLSMAYDHINFYESTEFTPNNQHAKDDVIAYKNTIPFEYFDTRILELVNLENIAFPEGDLAGAGIEFKDFSSSNTSNLKSYSVGYHYYNVEDTTFIKDLCKYVYDQGVKYDDGGVLHDFEEWYSEKKVNYGYVGLNIINFNAYVIINDVKYHVALQGQSTWSEPKFWFVHLYITVM